MHILTVTNTGSASSRCPGFYLVGQWLPDMGFAPGALVQALPEPGGIVFNLCDENIRKYSELDAETQERGGKLIQAFSSIIKGKQCSLLMTSGQYLIRAGLDFGDLLMASYEPGLIRVRKLPPTSRVVRTTSVKDKFTGRAIPKVRLSGDWLAGFGFTTGKPVTALPQPGSIALELHGASLEQYSGLVRSARQNKMKLLQVRETSTRGKPYPYIMLMGSCLDKAGFGLGDALLASCKQGGIKLQRLEHLDFVPS